jgi:hypothetical protein
MIMVAKVSFICFTTFESTKYFALYIRLLTMFCFFIRNWWTPTPFRTFRTNLIRSKSSLSRSWIL